MVSSGLHYKHITVVNYDSSVVNKFGASLTDNARVVIYDSHMFIVQATGLAQKPLQSWKALPGTNTLASSKL